MRAELESSGVEFLGDVHDGLADSWGTSWSHFRAPDGQIYVLISRPSRHPAAAVRAFDELRICSRVDDLDEAVRAYRDGLGMPIVDEWIHPGGQRGVLFGVAPSAIELFDGPQWDLVDGSEAGQLTGTDHAVRVEVRDRAGITALAERLEASGVARVGEIVHTPWDQDCLRMSGGGNRQLTLFALPEDERRVREDARARLPY
ncbi:VOC family protein [Rhodococcus sp. NPDC003383]